MYIRYTQVDFHRALAKPILCLRFKSHPDFVYQQSLSISPTNRITTTSHSLFAKITFFHSFLPST